MLVNIKRIIFVKLLTLDIFIIRHPVLTKEDCFSSVYNFLPIIRLSRQG